MIDVHGFYPDNTENQALYKIADTLEGRRVRQQGLDYQRQKDADADQWKKLNLIQDLTDLSKHQTGNDVADAVANQKASQILQRFTADAQKMSPNELLMKVQKEMSGLISGVDAMKKELNISDEQLKLIKQSYPGVDISKLAQTLRADVVNRRMKGEEFVNPLEVAPSQLNLGDPEVLSDFVADDSGLIKAISTPQGGEAESVLMGKQGDYTKFEGKLNYWKKPNYDRTKFDSEGFYGGKEIPSFVTKGSELPSDALPSSNGKPFKIIDKDVLEQFSADSNQRLGLLAATKRRYPTYNTFNPQEKEYAQRNVLYDMVETLDPSQLHPTQNVRPQVTNIRNYSGGGKPPARTWDLSEFEDVPDKDNGNGKDITQPFSGFKVTAIGGDALLAKKVVFHPSTKKFTVTEYLSRDDKGNPTGEKTKTWSASSFRQIIENMNPGTDMKNFDALVERNVGGDVRSSNTESKEDEKPQEQKPKRWYERGGDIRVPKDVKNTKMTTKPSWAN